MATTTWISATSSTWNTGTNWSGGSVPVTGDTVIIDTATALTITLNTTTGNLDFLTLAGGTGATLTATGIRALNVDNTTSSLLTIAGGSLDFGSNTFQVAASNVLVSGGAMTIGTGNAKLSVFKTGGSNTLTLTGGSITHTSGQFNIGLEFGSSGVMTIASGGTLAMSGGVLSTPSMVMAGGVFNHSGGTATIGAFNNFSGGTLAMSGTALLIDAGAAQFNSGMVVSLTDNAKLDLTGSISSNSATVSVGGSALIESDSTFTLNSGVVTLSGNGSIKGATGIANNGTIIGAGTVDGAITGGGGTFTADGGTLTLTGTTTSFNNSYNITNNDSSVMRFNNKVGQNTITFDGGNGTLAIADLANFQGTVAGLKDTVTGLDGNADTGVMRILGLSIDSGAIVNGNTIQLIDAGTTYNVAFSGGSFISGAVKVGLNFIGGDTIVWVDDSVCYAAGTSIATTTGEQPIEALCVGDHVITLRDGKHVSQPVKWIGRRHVDLANHPDHRAVAPIRIRAGALGDGIPKRDLLVSPPHAIMIDGHLIEAWRLVNGMSITRDMQCATVDYYHIELNEHAVVLAEGAPAETYLDDGNRAFFANAPVATMANPVYQRADRQLCLPLLTDRDAIAPHWARLARRAAAQGLPVGRRDAALHLWADGRRIDPIEVHGRRHRFLVPGAMTSLRVRSTATATTDYSGVLGDERVLGIPVWRVVARIAETVNEIAMDHPAFVDGWHAAERDGTHVYRWTNGDAALPIAATGVSFVLEIEAGEPASPAAMIEVRLAA